MYCTHCGKEIPDTSKFCEYCGQKVEAVAEAEVAQPADQAPPKRRIPIVGILAILLVLVSAVVFGPSLLANPGADLASADPSAAEAGLEPATATPTIPATDAPTAESQLQATVDALSLAGITSLRAAWVAAVGHEEPVGERLSLILPEGESQVQFNANTPFNITHGWAKPEGVETSELPNNENSGFLLEMDGEILLPDFLEEDESGIRWGYNFPEGLSGEYTLVGHWFLACKLGEEDPANDCTDLEEFKEYNTVETAFTFTD